MNISYYIENENKKKHEYVFQPTFHTRTHELFYQSYGVFTFNCTYYLKKSVFQSMVHISQDIV